MSELPEAIFSKAATIARGLAIDAVLASQSGHLGLPLGCAEIGAVLYGHALRHYPAHPEWLEPRSLRALGRPRLDVPLRAGCTSAATATCTLDEIKRFRQLALARRRGTPSSTHAPSGVETTTGPLGQGVANAVGMAVGAKMAEARFNTAEHTIFDHHVVCLAGDGCMQEGVAMEALEFAGHQKLDNLILIYDSNAVTLDAMAKETQSEDAAKRFEAHRLRRRRPSTATRWRPSSRRSCARRRRAAASRSSSSPRRSSARASPRSRARRRRTARAARSSPTPRARRSACPRSSTSSRPRCARSSPQREKELERRVRRLDEDVRRLEGDEPEARRRSSRTRGPSPQRCPRTRRSKTPDAAALLAAIPEFPADTKIATRKAGQDVLQPLAAQVPLLIGGSADLYGSTLNYIGDLKTGNDDFKPGAPRRAQHPLRHPRARHVRDPERHRRARHLPPERRDVPGLRRLLPRRRSAWRRSATCRSSTSSRTTASASARTARRTSRSRRSPACA